MIKKLQEKTIRIILKDDLAVFCPVASQAVGPDHQSQQDGRRTQQENILFLGRIFS